LFYILTGPTIANAQKSDVTQAATTDDGHKKLISKLEVLEQRVEKLESENQELKEESKKHAEKNSDEENAEKKTSEIPVKTEVNSKTVEHETVKLDKKNDNLLTPVGLGKDNKADHAVHHPPANSLQSNSPVKPQLEQEQQQQQLTHDDTKTVVKEDKATYVDPVKKEFGNENDKIDSKNSEEVQHKDQGKLTDHLPDLNVDKNTNLDLALQPDSQKEDKTDKGNQKHQDDVSKILEKPDLKINNDLPKLSNNDQINAVDQNAEQKIPSDQDKLPVGQTKRSVDENLQTLEEGLPKLDTGVNVKVLSRDILHDKDNVESDDNAKSTTESPSLQSDDALTTAPSAVNKGKSDESAKSTTESSELQSDKVDSTQTTATQNILKRNMLSLKLTNDSESHLLSNG